MGCKLWFRAWERENLVTELQKERDGENLIIKLKKRERWRKIDNKIYERVREKLTTGQELNILS